MNMKIENVYSEELYEYYKKWLNTSLQAYRDSNEGVTKEHWLKLAHRASCLTDLWLRLNKEFSRKKYE